MKKQFLLFLQLLIVITSFNAQTALAQSYSVGQQTPTYATTNAVSNKLGDGTTNPRGGEAPAFAYEHAEVPDNFLASDWTTTFASAPAGTFEPVSATTGEVKFRNGCNVTFDGDDDPLLFYNVPNGSPHRHDAIGNTDAASAFYAATYDTLRASGHSTCWAGMLNRSLYWEPALYTVQNGILLSIKPLFTFYYSCGFGQNDGDKCTRWARGWNVISGFNMSDPTNSRVNDVIAAANAASAAAGGSAARYSSSSIPTGTDPLGRYSPPTSPSGAMSGFNSTNFNGWKCGTARSGTSGVTAYAVTGTYQPYLVDENGHDTLDCQWPGILYAQVFSMPCWDGKNLSSPGARKHMMPFIWDNVKNEQVCPTGWYRVMQLQVLVQYYVKDATEYHNLYLSSDRMPGMTQFRNGESFHFDFIPAWSYGYGDAPGPYIKFFTNCGGGSVHLKNSDGVTYTDIVGVGHTCEGSVWSNTEAGKDNIPPDGNAGPNPIYDQFDGITGTDRYMPLKKGAPIGGGKGHVQTSMNDNMPMEANDNQLAGAAPITFDLGGRSVAGR